MADFYCILIAGIAFTILVGSIEAFIRGATKPRVKK